MYNNCSRHVQMYNLSRISKVYNFTWPGILVKSFKNILSPEYWKRSAFIRVHKYKTPNDFTLK